MALTEQISNDPCNFDEDHPDYDGIMASLSAHGALTAPKPRDFVFEQLLARGEISALFGDPGATKSALAVDIACKVSWGLSWEAQAYPDRIFVDKDRAKTGLPRTTCLRCVLYIAAERPGQVHRRVNAFCIEHNIESLDGLILHRGGLDLSASGDHLEKIIKCAKSASWRDTNGEGGFDQIDLVVIDTLAAAMAKPDSDTTATATVAANLANAASATGAHIMIVHHAPLNREKRLRGGHLTGAMDSIIHVAQKRGHSVATVVKDNESAERPRLFYALKSIDVECSDGTTSNAPVIVPGKPSRDEPDETIKLTPHREAALDALVNAAKDAPATEAAWRKIHDAIDPDSPTNTLKVRFRRSRDWLSENGMVIKEGDHWIPAPQESPGVQKVHSGVQGHPGTTG